MKQQTYKQYEGLETTDWIAAVEALNRFSRAHADGDPVGEIREGIGNTYRVLVGYTITDRLPETELEELEEKHGCHRCWECPCLDQDTDRRRKSYPCLRGGEHRTDSPCCEWFYEQVEAGKIKVGD